MMMEKKMKMKASRVDDPSLRLSVDWDDLQAEETSCSGNDSRQMGGRAAPRPSLLLLGHNLRSQLAITRPL